MNETNEVACSGGQEEVSVDLTHEWWICSTQTGETSHQQFFFISTFITGLILYPIICTTGLIGNILVLIVLSNRKMASSTNVYLSGLAVADSIKLLNDLNYFIMSVLLRHSPEAANRMYGYLYAASHYIFNFSVCVASWLTVCVGFDRYVVVCKPTRAKQICTIARSRLLSCMVFLIMAVLTIPSALRYKRQVITDPVTNKTSFEIVVTGFGETEEFMVPYAWVINLLRSCIPICILIFLNGFIIHTLRRQRILRHKNKVKMRVTFMLIVVIVVFVLCVSPDAVMSTVFGLGYIEASCLVRGIREYTDCLLAFNSMINFIIYCVCNAAFRHSFIDIFFSNRQTENIMYTLIERKHKKRNTSNAVNSMFDENETLGNRFSMDISPAQFEKTVVF